MESNQEGVYSMKILFLHLSDLHISSKDTLSYQKLDAIINSLKSVDDFDECIIIVSGDIAFSGKEEEYSITYKLFGYLLKNISNKYLNGKKINLLMVPGNHDLLFSKNYDRKVIVQEKKENLKLFLSKYLGKLSSFFNLSKVNKCFLIDNLIDVVDLNVAGKLIRAVLINSAPFSTLKDSDNDFDIGLHYLPNSKLDFLKNFKNDADFTFAVLHHPVEYFEESVKFEMREIFSNYNAVFFGHEHRMSNIDVITNKFNDKVMHFSGGVLSGDDNFESTFNCLLCNFDRVVTSKKYEFKWDSNQKYYSYDNFELHQHNGGYKFENHNLSFIDKLNCCVELPNIKLSDVFVFPELSIDEDKKRTTVSNIEAFLKYITDKKYIFIEGDDYSGKSALAKTLFFNYSQKMFPLFLDLSEHKTFNEKTIERVFSEEYKVSKFSFQRFEQLDSSEKVLIIDHNKEIDLNRFVSSVASSFDKIFFISSKTLNFDILDQAKNEVLYKDKIVRLKIESFYYEKRHELIRNICQIKKIDKDSIEEVSKKINDKIKNDLNFFTLNPGFISLYVVSYLDNTISSNEKNVFNAVFNANITNLISSNPKLDVSSTIYVLQLLAFYMYRNSRYPISEADFVQIIEKYNNDGIRSRPPIKALELLNNLISIRILKYTDEGVNIKFNSDNYFSFFIAKELLRNYLQGKEVTTFNTLVENVCFGINSDILIFMCYLVDNLNLINTIIEKSKMFFSDVPVFTLEDEKYKSIFCSDKKICLDVPTVKDKDKVIQSQTEAERKHKKNSESGKQKELFTTKKINELNTVEKFRLGFKYIEIVSKILPDFIHMMDDQIVDDCVEAYYQYPNKLLEIIYSTYINYYIQDTNEYLELKTFLNNDEELLMSLLKIIKKRLQLIMLDVFNYPAKIIVNKNTIFALENYKYKENVNNFIQNAMLYDNYGNTEKMGKRLEKIDKMALRIKNVDHTTIVNVISMIIRKHCIYSNVRYVGYNQSLIDKYLKKFDLKKHQSRMLELKRK